MPGPNRILGVAETLAKMEVLSKTAKKGLYETIRKATMMVQTRAKENISGLHGHVKHIDTGNLRRNIKSKTEWVNPRKVEGFIGTDVPYAPYVEALPDGGYLIPALFEMEQAIKEMIETELDIILRGAI